MLTIAATFRRIGHRNKALVSDCSGVMLLSTVWAPSRLSRWTLALAPHCTRASGGAIGGNEARSSGTRDALFNHRPLPPPQNPLSIPIHATPYFIYGGEEVEVGAHSGRERLKGVGTYILWSGPLGVFIHSNPHWTPHEQPIIYDSEML